MIALLAVVVDWSNLNDVPAVTTDAAEPSAPPPPPVRGQLIGVQLHPFFDDQTPATLERELDLARAAGAGAVRIDVSWSSLYIDGPTVDSGYASRVDAVVDGARRRGLRVIAAFLSTPCWASTAPESLKQGCQGRWWERGVTEYPPIDPGSFGDAAAYVARRWGDRIAALEIWNEPNNEIFLRTQDPAREYGRLLRAAYPRVKAERPRLPVLAGTFALADEKFLEQLYDDGGIAGNYDGLAWHPYTHPYSPRARASRAGVESSFRDGADALRRIMRKRGDRRAELWATEAGATTCADRADERCVDADTQARWIRDYVEVARDMPWLRALIVYNLRDKGTDPNDVEQGFGLVRSDFSPKPSFAAFRSVLSGR